MLLAIAILTIKANAQNTKDLNFKNIISYMDSIGIQYKSIVLKQICHESNYLKHKKAIKKQNILGLSRNRGLIKFKNWRNCLDFYKLKFQSNLPKDSICYYTYLKKRKYASDKKYIAKLKKIKVNKILNESKKDSLSIIICEEWRYYKEI